MSIKRAVVMALCAVLIALCIYQAYQAPALLQYVMPAPALPGKEAKVTPMEQALERLRSLTESWEGIISATAVTGEAAGVAMTGTRTATARLTGEYGSGAALPARLLRFGRNFYPEELRRGDKVAILDEQLAIALFRVGDPIGREVEIGGETYTVVGVARHARQAGDQEAYGACVPLLALKNAEMATLTFWAKPVAGAGAQSKFKADMTAFDAKGCLYSLGKERFRAVLPAWLMATTVGLLLLLALFRAYGWMVKGLYRNYQERLEHRFAVQMTPRLIAYALLGAWVLAGLLALCYGWAQLALMPVTAFPEWVPAVPVEVSEIMNTYWQNVRELGRASELRSREVMTLRMWRMILRPLCLLEGALAIHTLGRMRKRT